MISKKELDDRTWENFKQINRHGNSLKELRRQIVRLSEQDNHLVSIGRVITERMNNIDRAYGNAISAVNSKFNALDVAAKVEIDALKKQIQCGIVGHKFELMVVTIDNTDDGRYNGQFKCTNCGVEVTFELDEQEIESARTLGMIQ